MKVIYMDKMINDYDDVCVALGFFDGFHIGHQQLFSEVERICAVKNLKKALFTFDCQPRSFILNAEESYLTSLNDKIELAKKYEFDYVFVLPLSKQVISMQPDTFIREILIRNNIKEIVCGYDYHFGIKKSGSIENLKQYTEFNVTVVDKVEYLSNRISSTVIRQCLQEGDIALARAMLGHDYKIKGEVIYGKQRGRLLGYATANIDYCGYVLPKRGVYATLIDVDGIVYYSMTNIGVNPTFGDLEKPSLEVHIFDFDKDIYGNNVSVFFIERIRGEIQFGSLEELKEQLLFDKTKIVECFLKKA